MQPENNNQPPFDNKDEFNQQPPTPQANQGTYPEHTAAAEPTPIPPTSSWATPPQATTPTPAIDNSQPAVVPPAGIAGAPAQPVPSYQQPQAVFGQANPTLPPEDKPRKKKKLMLAGGIVAAVIVLAGGGVGAYFGIIAPNQPDYLWKKGLSNTADAYDKLVESSNKREEKKSGAFKGDFKYTAKDVAADGTIDSKFNEKNASVKIDAGASGVRFGVEVLALVPDNSKNPDIYAKVTGLGGIDKILGSEAAGAGAALTQFDNQWYVVDHTLFDQLDTSAGDKTIPDNLSKEDIKAISDAVGRVNREYIFTTDESKAVLTKTENVGKEKFDGRDAYHFKVGYKKDKLKAYAAAMNTELKKTKLSSYLTDADLTEINASIDKLNDAKQADAWVDTKTKLIRNIRITTNEANQDQINIGQQYNGGDEVPFVLSFTSKEKDNDGTATLKLTTNMKSDDIKIAVDGKGNESGSPITFTMNGTFTASNDEVKIDKPAGAKSVLDLYSELLGSSADSSLMSGTSSL